MGQLIYKAPLVRFGETIGFSVRAEILVPKLSVALEIAAGPAFQWPAEVARCKFVFRIRVRRQGCGGKR